MKADEEKINDYLIYHTWLGSEEYNNNDYEVTFKNIGREYVFKSRENLYYKKIIESISGQPYYKKELKIRLL